MAVAGNGYPYGEPFIDEGRVFSIENESKIAFNNGDSFEENISKFMKEGHIPSLSTCIVKNGSVVWKKGYGYSNIYKRIRATEDTIYLGASLSKIITATAVMQLWEKGLFDLDDDVNNYLPFPLRNPNFPDVNITFRMLLAHHSSLARGKFTTLIFFTLLDVSKEDLKDYLTPSGKFFNPDLWTTYKPGEKLFYSNLGYLILEYLVELLSQMSFDQYCEEFIFEPLEMENTSFQVKDFTKNRLARPYIWASVLYLPLPHYQTRYYGMGGIRTSVIDLSHFLIASTGAGVFKGVRILSNQTLELMQTPHFTINNSSTWYVYGLGWRIYHFNDSYIIGHPGGMPGTQTFMQYAPDTNIGIIGFTNQYPFNSDIDITPLLNIMFLLYQKGEEFP
jgi:CubicO group peptidase (beta-lactamase class C family)